MNPEVIVRNHYIFKKYYLAILFDYWCLCKGALAVCQIIFGLFYRFLLKLFHYAPFPRLF